jgi:hypothetical protein
MVPLDYMMLCPILRGLGRRKRAELGGRMTATESPSSQVAIAGCRSLPREAISKQWAGAAAGGTYSGRRAYETVAPVVRRCVGSLSPLALGVEIVVQQW